MDADRFDALSRALIPNRHRRSLLRAISGAVLATLSPWLVQGEADACRRKGRRCRRNRQCCCSGVCKRRRCRCRGANTVCGKSCCRDCFVEANPDEPPTAFCCPSEQVCRSPEGPERDLCCYSEPGFNEVCLAGTCCRICGDGLGGLTCCRTTEFCSATTNRCESFSSARLHRFRR